MRYILLSFAFMSWAFYELSGGAEFDPDAFKAKQIAEYEAEKALEPKRQAPKTPEPVLVASAPKVNTAEEVGVTRVSLSLTSLQNTGERTAPATSGSGTADGSGIRVTEETPIPQNVSVTLSSADTPAIIPSLIRPNDGATTERLTTQTATQDIRTVAGNRVNVRGGPGTNFGVVGGLQRGDEIRVLEEDGTGWVRFETVDGATAGWMAAFLLKDS